MANFAYERLGFLDRSCLATESRANNMHVAGIGTYEVGLLRKPNGGVDVDRVREYVLSRLHLVPRYRQVIAYTAVERAPVWVDDLHFNIDYHVRHTSLPRPGDPQQLKLLAARIMSQQLDRAKPLWEMWIVEGLQGGEQFAVITKIHHCMIDDGLSSVDLQEVLLTPEPIGTVEPPPRWIPRPAPTSWQLFWAESIRRVQMPFGAVRSLRRVLADSEDPNSDVRGMLRAARDTLRTGSRSVSDTPLNRTISAHRRFDWLCTSLDEVKTVKHPLGCTLHDLVLATVAGAVQRFLEARRVNVEPLDFRVMAPVSVRTEREPDTLGNRVSAWMIDLPIAERDPCRRLELIREATRPLKEAKQALGAEVLSRVASWTPSTLLSLGARMLTRALPFNLVVINVPGPQVPLHLLGSRMIENYGLTPLTDHLGLGVVLFSYAGKLCWGFTADWDLVPDIHDFVRATEASFLELRDAAARLHAAPPARRRTTPRLPLEPPAAAAAPAERLPPRAAAVATAPRRSRTSA